MIVTTTTTREEVITAVSFDVRVVFTSTREEGEYLGGCVVAEVFFSGPPAAVGPGYRRRVWPIQMSKEDIIANELPGFLRWPS